MKNKRFQQIKNLCDLYDDLPDGAFFAVLSENGVSIDDLVAYAAEYERRLRQRVRV